MTQLEIKYFFPLTEQIPLDLDFSQCSPHQYWIRAQGIAGTHGPFNTGMVYKFADSNVTPGLQIDLDQCPVTVVSKNKPNIFRRYFYKVMGVKWKAK
jgi:hypothetical protein